MTALPQGSSLPSDPEAGSSRRRGRERNTKLRNARETIIVAMLIGCGVFTVGTMVMILYILLSNTVDFFGRTITDVAGNEVEVSVFDFLTGLEWNPLLGAEKHFGVWPLIAGTLQVATVAMCFALPLGLMVAIWLSEYASPRVRAVIKPVLEVIAGVPTVVFGFFALTFITPSVRSIADVVQPLLNWIVDLGIRIPIPMTNYVFVAWWSDPQYGAWNPLRIDIYNVLAAGLAVGIMCLPIVTSLSEDALRAVPRALREGSYGLGSSRFETATKVVVPAALSGIVAAFLLAIARAVGETMIVALAAGQLPANLYENPSAVLDVTGQTQTMTGYIVQIFKGDVSHASVEYYSVYAVAFMLFVITLLLTLVGGVIRKRFRQEYD
ncbi:MAG: phosphate ABC transporter permease subunit PstC [Planctomycetota bacterium]